MDNEQVYTDWDKVYSTEEWKTLKWDLGQIFSDHIHITATGAIEGNPSIHRMAQYAWRYAQSHSQQASVLTGMRWVKASERLPAIKEDWQKECNSWITRWNTGNGPHVNWKNIHEIKELRDNRFVMDLEYLDESTSIPFPTEQEIRKWADEYANTPYLGPDEVLRNCDKPFPDTIEGAFLRGEKKIISWYQRWGK